MNHSHVPAAADTTVVPDAARKSKRLTIGLLVLLVGLLFVLWDWNWFKGPTERRVEAATGREFRIEGNLDVELDFFRPTIVADGVVLSNADWAQEPEMFRADNVRIQWAVWRMFRGQVLLPHVELQAPRLLLERGEAGVGNWQFDDEPNPDPETDPDFPDIEQLLVHDGRFRFVEPQYETDFDVTVNSGEAEVGLAPLLVDGKGRYRDSEFTLEGRVDSPVALFQEGDAPATVAEGDGEPASAVAPSEYHIDLSARAGATHAHAFGGLPPPLQLGAFDVDFELSGDDMRHLYTLLGLAMPKTPPYTLEGRLGRDGPVWHYNGFSGVVGDSDLAGDATVDTSGERTKLVADMVSERLDFDDLAGFIGGTPRAGEGDAAAPAVPSDPSRVFPSRDYDAVSLRKMDADVRLQAHHVNSPKLPLDSMTAHLLLEDGDLHLNPLNFGVAGGTIESVIHLDARQTPMGAEADVHARKLQLQQLADIGAVPESAGLIGGRIQLSGRGNSVAALMASADGEAQLGMGSGRISNLLIELAGIDIFEALKFLIGKDRVIPIRCAYADLGVADGVATSRQFAFDTTDTVLFVEGEVYLGDERFDLRLKPRPKDPSPLSLRSPLRLTGNFKDPQIRPEAGPLLLRGAIAAVLYAIAPPAAILALIETGPGEDTGCGIDNPKITAETDANTNAGPPTDD